MRGSSDKSFSLLPFDSMSDCNRRDALPGLRRFASMSISLSTFSLNCEYPLVISSGARVSFIVLLGPLRFWEWVGLPSWLILISMFVVPSSLSRSKVSYTLFNPSNCPRSLLLLGFIVLDRLAFVTFSDPFFALADILFFIYPIYLLISYAWAALIRYSSSSTCFSDSYYFNCSTSSYDSLAPYTLESYSRSNIYLFTSSRNSRSPVATMRLALSKRTTRSSESFSSMKALSSFFILSSLRIISSRDSIKEDWTRA